VNDGVNFFFNVDFFGFDFLTDLIEVSGGMVGDVVGVVDSLVDGVFDACVLVEGIEVFRE